MKLRITFDIPIKDPAMCPADCRFLTIYYTTGQCSAFDKSIPLTADGDEAYRCGDCFRAEVQDE
jgi:hypothetical protein